MMTQGKKRDRNSA